MQPSQSLRALALLTAGIFAVPLPSPAAEAPKEDSKKGPLPVAKTRQSKKVDFEKQILPILRRNCLSCHNSQKGEDGVNLETPQTIAKGGDTGKIVEPKKPESSSLFRVAAHMSKPVMPPAGNKAGAKNCTPEELALLKQWIEEGATGEVKGGGPIVWQPLPEGLNPIYAVALTEDGQFAAAGRANQIHLFHIPTATAIGRLTDGALLADKTYARPGVAHRDMTYALAFSPDGNTLASGSYREIKLWQRPVNVQKQTLPGAAELLAASPDGKWLAAASGNDIKLWALPALTPGKTLTGHTSPVKSIGFATNSARLVSGADKTARVWNLADGSLFAELTATNDVASVAILPDGKRIATAHADKNLLTWKLPEAAGGKVEPGPVIAAAASITHLAALPPAQLLASGPDGIVRVFNAENGSTIRTVTGSVPTTALAVSPDGKTFASLGLTNVAAKLWNAADGKALAEIRGDRYVSDRVAAVGRDLTFANNEVTFQKAAQKKAEDDQKKADEAAKKAEEERVKLEKPHAENVKKLAEATTAKEAADKAKTDADAPQKKANDAKEAADKAATEADAAAKTTAEALAKADAAAKPAAEKTSKEAADKAKAAADAKAAAEKALTDANAKLKEATDKFTAENKKFTDATAEVRKYTDAEDAAKRAATDAKRAVDDVAKTKKDLESAEAAQKKADTAAADAKKAQTDDEKIIRSLAFSLDGKQVVTAGEDGVVRTWSAADGSALENFKGHTGAVKAVALVAGAVVSAGSDGKLIAWDSQPEWKLVRTIGSATGASPITGRVNTLAFSPDGKALASGSGEPSRSGELRLWDAATGALVKEFKGAHSDTVQSLNFSGDGKLLASGGADRFVKAWTVADTKLVKSFEGHTHQVLGVTLKRDGRIIASAGADNAVKVWSLVTGEIVRTIQGFSKEATSISHVGVGDQFLATGGDGKVRLINEGGSDARTFTGASDFMYSAAGTPDGKVVIAGGQDGVLRVWNGANGNVIVTFEPPKSATPEPQKTAAAGK
jgi:WD40 repeat protein